MEVDQTLKELGASAVALRPQESCNCNRVSYKHMGLFVILVLILMLAPQRTLIWPDVLPQLLAVIVSAPFVADRKEKRSK